MTSQDTPVTRFIDDLWAGREAYMAERFGWMETAAEQIRKWRAEDEAAGMPWDDTPRDGERANNASPSE